MSQTQPFPLADDFTPPPPPGEPDYLANAPLWFTAWRREEFVPFRTSVTRRLSVQQIGIAFGKYVGAGIVGAVAVKWPAVAHNLQPVLDFLAQYGGG